MCSVQAQHVDMLIMFGRFMLAGGILSFLTGTTYYRGLIRRDEEPFRFWSGTIGLILLGGMILLAVKYC